MAKDIEVEIFLDGGKKFTSDIKKIGKSTEKVSKSFSKAQATLVTLNAGFQLLGGAVRIANRAFSSLIRLGNSALQASSDFEEANQKFSVVFKDLQKSSNETRDELIKDFGLSKQASTELLGSTGDLLTGFGFTQKSALELSGTVNKLAVDLASFQNLQGGSARASEILTKALVGQTDSLSSLGIALRQDTKEFKSRVAQIQENESVTLLQAKSLAILSIALEQTKNAQGDYKRSLSSLENQQKLLNSRLDDLAITLGDNLVPVTKIFVAEIVQVIDKMSAWADQNKDLFASGVIEGAQFFATAINVVGQTLLFTVRALNSTVATMKIAGSGFIALAQLASLSVFSMLESFASFAEGAVRLIRDPLNTIRRIFLSTALAINKDLEGIVSFGEKLLPKGIVDDVKNNVATLQESLRKLSEEAPSGQSAFSESLRETNKGIRKNIESLALQRQALLDSGLATFENNDSIDKLSDGLSKLNNKLQDNLSLIKKRAEAGTLFNEGGELSDTGGDAEQVEADKQANLEAIRLEAQSRQKEAILAFKDFERQTEQGQIDEIRENRLLELEGFALLQADKATAVQDGNDVIKEINLRAIEEEAKVRQSVSDAKEADRVAELENFKKAEQQKVVVAQSTGRLLSSLANLARSEGEKNFKIVQGLRIGEAIMNTYAGVTGALAMNPWTPANFITASAVLVQGLANVNQIRSATPTRAQHGIDMVQTASQQATLHFGETVLNRNETAELREVLDGQTRNAGSQGGGTTVRIDNLQLLAEDDRAIGNLVTAIQRNINEQNLQGI